MTLQISTLRPGLLVSLRTSLKGNCSYYKQILQPETITEFGAEQARWETTRTISDPIEHAAAKKAREKAGTIIRSICARSDFGLLCPEANADKLTAAIAEAREIADKFNETAKLTKIGIYVITGRVAPDDVEAVRAINAEVRELMESMQTGLKNLDVKVVREAANKARGLAQMLSPEAQERVKVAIDTARDVARKIVKAGEVASYEIDNAAIAKINEQRTAFLDIGDTDGNEVATPTHEGRAVDFDRDPDEPPPELAALAGYSPRDIEMELR
jgi:hypothetical protein